MTAQTLCPPLRPAASGWRRLATLAPALLLAPLMGLLPNLLLVGSAQAQDDWRSCAQEGQICRVSGEAMLRFGSKGRYVFRMSSEPQPCTVDAFGSDPAPGVRKQCEVSSNWRQSSRYRSWRDAGSEGWRFCAAEGGSCTAQGSMQARFGADGRYATRDVNGRFSCSTRTFGDPAPGRPKFCELADDGDWRLCANEGDLCRLPAGASQVRYGAEGRYTERQITQGSVACHNGVFGDPVPGLAKQCEYRRVGDGGGGGNGAGRLPWESCAREGEVCELRGVAMLRYGANGRYAYREAYQGLLCGNDSFGGDPAPGEMKRCDVLKLRR